MQQAYTYLLQAELYSPPELFLEKAKLHWLREEQEQALVTLKRGLGELLTEGSSNESPNYLSVEQRLVVRIRRSEFTIPLFKCWNRFRIVNNPFLAKATWYTLN